MVKIINILHLEDSINDSELVQSLIEFSDLKFKYFFIDNEQDYRRNLKEQKIDIILSDYNLPDYNGNEALKIAREQYSNIPFIFVSGMMGEDAAIGAMLNGATDYVIKNKMDRLVPAIKRALNEQELENNRIKSAIDLIEKSKQLELQNEQFILVNKELAYQNEEKEKRASELAIANTELIFQNAEKEKRAAELIIAKIKAEESDNLKTAFLQNITHEIRTPLNEIIGFSSLLNKGDISKTDITEFTGMIAQSGLRLIDIISNIIKIAKIQTGQISISRTEFMINSFLVEIHNNSKYQIDQKDIKIKLNIPNETSIMIFSDESKINRIFTILIKNAIKFTNFGSIEIGYIIKDNFIQFYVRDTGIGIEKSLHYKIFGKFVQVESSLSRSYEGAGLGLSICKGLVEILGGKIWVDSELGSGSTFFFTIPVSPQFN